MFFLPNKWSVVKTSVGSKLYWTSLLNDKEKQVNAVLLLKTRCHTAPSIK